MHSWNPDFYRPVPRVKNLSARGGLRNVNDYHRAVDAPSIVDRLAWWAWALAALALIGFGAALVLAWLVL